MRADLTLTVATIVTVVLASLGVAFGGHRAFCELRILLQLLIQRFEKHEADTAAELRRLDGRCDEQRDLIHAVDKKVGAVEALVKPVKRG